LKDHDYNIIGCKNFMQWFVNNLACLDSIRYIFIYIISKFQVPHLVDE
jgi:hypothetical protein